MINHLTGQSVQCRATNLFFKKSYTGFQFEECFMQVIRKSNQRGHANYGWLDTNHTFSFSDYYDPEFMGFSVLRVINEDKVAAGSGFPMHPHNNMEIITYVVEGALEHKDSMGNSSQILPGEVQHMSAGTGVRHSEWSVGEKGSMTHLYQIWLLPNKTGITPSYGQKSFSEQLKKGGLVLTASADGREGSLKINQDAELYVARLVKGQSSKLELSQDRKAWVQVVKGNVRVNGELLEPSDGAAFSEEEALAIKADSDAEVLIFNLP